MAFFYILFRIKCISAETSKKRILKFYLGGYSKKALQAIAHEYVQRISTNGIVKPEMVSLINTYISEGAEVVVVSASLDLWVEPFCNLYAISCLSTQIAYSENDIFEGEFKSPNCKGIEKVNRIKKAFRLEDYTDIIAYGDSSGDIEMMQLANIKNWV